VKADGSRILEIVDYDPSWPTLFETLRSRLLLALGNVADSIEHVGSTAVPGLAAKPIIDLDIVVESASGVPLAIERLAALGYRHRGDLGIDGREAFDSPTKLLAHNLYVCTQGSLALANHLTIRDYLRRHPEAAVKYGLLKRRLARQFRLEPGRYSEGKTEFLVGLLRETGFREDVLNTIVDMNRVTPAI
jgi:GrpB-like predicted nucleotidyltransferase (UPF0157 family)